MATNKNAPKRKKTATAPASEAQTPESARREKELQKETSTHIKSWLNPRKHRTLSLLSKKTHLSETSLREYLKGETRVSTHRALAIAAVCNPEGLIDFIENFLPEIFPAIQKSIGARANKKIEDSGVIQKITNILADADFIKSPIFQELARAVKFIINSGVVVGKGKKIALMGGISGGIVIKIDNSTFERVANTLQHSKSIRIEGDSYRLRASDENYNILTLEKVERPGWIFLCADRCKLFDETMKNDLENPLKPNADALQISE